MIKLSEIDTSRHQSQAQIIMNNSNTSSLQQNKVPEITLGFWLIKIMSTTVGETVADYLAVNADWGHMITTVAMCAFLIIALFLQLNTSRYIPGIYWLTVILVSIVGTQITDVLTDILNISLYTSTAVFSVSLAIIFFIWFYVEQTLSIRTIITRRRELFYWAAILCTFALGTAAGDLATEALGLGFKWGVVIFGAFIGVTLVAWYLSINAVLTFWIAYILTRPLGASLGDFLTQSSAHGGVGLGSTLTSAIFLSVILALVSVAHISNIKAFKTN